MRSKSKHSHGQVTKIEHRRLPGREGSLLVILSLGTDKYGLFTDGVAPPVSVGDRVSFDWYTRVGKKRKRYRNIIPESLNVIVAVEQLGDADGFVYVLTNTSLAGLVKVGYTTGLPEERCVALSGSTSIPTPFQVAWAVPIAGVVRQVEAHAHRRLAAFRVGKEYFKVSVQIAKTEILAVVRQLSPAQANCDDILEARQAAWREQVAAEKERQAQVKQEAEAQRAAKELERSTRLALITPNDATSFVVEHPRIRIHIEFEALDPNGYWAQRISTGSSRIEDAKPWRLNASWKAWIFSRRVDERFGSRAEAIVRAYDLCRSRGLELRQAAPSAPHATD